MSVKAWIQRADLSITEYPSVDPNTAVRLVTDHDWASELAFQRQLAPEDSSEDAATCPPGCGFVADDGHILHICPLEGGLALCHYHFPGDVTLLGLTLLRRQKTHTTDDMPWSAVPQVVWHFTTGDREYVRTNAWRTA